MSGLGVTRAVPVQATPPLERKTEPAKKDSNSCGSSPSIEVQEILNKSSGRVCFREMGFELHEVLKGIEKGVLWMDELEFGFRSSIESSNTIILDEDHEYWSSALGSLAQLQVAEGCDHLTVPIVQLYKINSACAVFFPARRTNFLSALFYCTS